MCDSSALKPWQWCERHGTEYALAWIKSRANSLAAETVKDPYRIVRLEALYDCSLPAVTVVLHYRRTAEKQRRIRQVAFSLTEKARYSSDQAGAWWKPIYFRIKEACWQVSCGFARNCRWELTNAPGTHVAATVKELSDEEIADVDAGRAMPFFGFVDLRFPLPKPPRDWRIPVRLDNTPHKFRNGKACACGRMHGHHRSDDLCLPHHMWMQDKVRWLAWYRQNYHREPVSDANGDDVMSLPQGAPIQPSPLDPPPIPEESDCTRPIPMFDALLDQARKLRESNGQQPPLRAANREKKSHGRNRHSRVPGHQHQRQRHHGHG